VTWSTADHRQSRDLVGRRRLEHAYDAVAPRIHLWGNELVTDSVQDYPSEQRSQALIVLTLLVWPCMVLAGALKLGFLTRFVSNAVMTGFITGIAVNIGNDAPRGPGPDRPGPAADRSERDRRRGFPQPGPTTSGQVSACGYNNLGQLGDGTTTNRSSRPGRLPGRSALAALLSAAGAS
jgi:hypothetical protein